VKILGDGELTKSLTVRAHAFSARAREVIEAAGGSAQVVEQGAAASTDEALPAAAGDVPDAFVAAPPEPAPVLAEDAGDEVEAGEADASDDEPSVPPRTAADGGVDA
jgi:hypothetical protein